MTLVVPSIGRQKTLEYIVGKISNGNLKLHLFSINHTPALGDTLVAYTECAAAGYSAVTLTGANWTAATVNNVTTATYTSSPMPTFTLTAADTLYGYFITDSAGTSLLWAELFPAVYNISSFGGSVVVTPVIGET